MRKKLLLFFALLFSWGANLAFGQELTGVTDATVWDFSSISFSKNTTAGQLLADNTLYIGANVNSPSGGRAVFSSSLSATPTTLGENMIAIKTAVAGQIILKLSCYNGNIVVSADGSEVKPFDKGNTYHGGSNTYLNAYFNAEAGKTYCIYTTTSGISASNNVGVFQMFFYPLANTTTAFSADEVVTKTLTGFPRVEFQGITYDNVYMGRYMAHSSNADRMNFKAKATTPITSTSDNVISFKIPANAKGTLTVKPSCYNGEIVLSDGSRILETYKKSDNKFHNQDVVTNIDNSSSEEELALYLYSTADGIDNSKNVGIYYFTWTPAGYHNYTINAVDGNGAVLKTIATGKAQEEQNYTVGGIPFVINVSGAYYMLSDSSVVNLQKAWTMGTEDQTNTVAYQHDPTIAFYAEVEDLGNAEASAWNDSYSGGKYGAINTGKYGTLSSFAPATYEVTGRFLGNANRGLYLRSSQSNISTNVIAYINDKSTTNSATFTLTEATTLYLSGFTNEQSSVNKSADLDYVLIRTQAVPAAISAAGYATFSSSYPLNFSAVENLKAYVASAVQDDGTVLLTKVDNIPAANGVLLKGAAGSYSIPVVADTSSPASNLFVGTVSATAVEASTSGSCNYMLANGTKGVGFYNVAAATTSGAGKAYLHTTQALTTENSARVGLNFSDEVEANGIVTVESGRGNVAEYYYNMQGVRVQNPAKGLYVVGGKKIIIK